MSPDSRGPARPLFIFLLGVAATLLVAAFHLAGWDRRGELQALDFRFAHLSTAPENDRIVHIDIDDRSLEELGRWPWDRARLAGIVEILNQTGAGTIALDIIMPEPQETRYVSAATELLTAETGKLLGTAPPRPVFDDKRLREAMSTRPNVFVPMHVNLSPDQLHPVETRVRDIMQSETQPDLRTVVRSLLPELAADTRNEQLDMVQRAYLRFRGLRGLRRFALPLRSIGSYPVRSGTIIPPLTTLAEVCYGSGFVTVDPDIDGVVRRIPLLARHGESAYPQFALALAVNELGKGRGGRCTITAQAANVTISCGDGFQRTIPVDQRGDMLINWIRPSRDRTRETRPRHISAAFVGGIWELQGRMRHNKDVSRVVCLDLAKALEQSDLLKLFERADQLYQQRKAAEFERERALLFAPSSVPPNPDALLTEEKNVEHQIDKLCTELIKAMDDFYLAEEPEEASERRLYLELKSKRELLRRLTEANEQLQGQFEQSAATLRQYVEGRICLIGSTATGAADFVPTAINKRTAGVVVHSNILNTILSGVFVRSVPRVVDLLAILLAGSVVSYLTATRPVWLAGPVAILLGLAYAAANALIVFRSMNFWLVFWAPLGAMAASFAVVTAYRQLTEERAKRRIRALFAHALSPALVDRLVEDPSLAKLGGERRELSFFFSDLQGFTAMSERLGEEQTVKLLNRYFDRMTDVIQNRHGGYLNKFLGDGLFVFFGAPVVQEDHAARAILAAMDCQREIVLLNQQLTEEFSGQVQLNCRIGISTGDVMVGNCGSSQRMDYTAIGDPVNLASRLETANKFFGTQILIAGAAWEAGGNDALLARPLGKVVVVGKNEPVSVWNLVCEKTEGSDELIRAYAEFATAIELFQNRRFSDAAQAFTRIHEVLGDDKPTEIFGSLSRDYQANPPGDDWDGALHLTEK